MAPGHPSHPHSTTNLANSLLLEWATKSNNPNNNNNNICSSNLLAVTKFKEFGVCFALIFAVLKKYQVSPIQGPHRRGVPHSNQVENFNSICVSKLTNVCERPFKVTNVCT
jgi:hypothetical protein